MTMKNHSYRSPWQWKSWKTVFSVLLSFSLLFVTCFLSGLLSPRLCEGLEWAVFGDFHLSCLVLPSCSFPGVSVTQTALGTLSPLLGWLPFQLLWYRVKSYQPYVSVVSCLWIQPSENGKYFGKNGICIENVKMLFLTFSHISCNITTVMWHLHVRYSA